MRRRALLAGLGAGLLLPLGGRSFAMSGEGEHRFLFIHCTGGWDHLMVFTPVFDPELVARSPQEQSAVAASVGGLDFVDHPMRGSVREFLERYAERTAFVHGVEVRSVAHDVCRRLMLTGSSRPGEPDWGTRLAASSGAMLPMLVMSGPSYAGDLGRAVVRLGEDGQLVSLLDGSWQRLSEPQTQLPSDPIQALEDAFALQQSQRFAESAPAGQGQDFAQAAVSSQERVLAMGALKGLSLGLANSLAGSASSALDLFESGRATCVALEYLGAGELGFDTHAANDTQSIHFGSLFLELRQIMEDLDSRVDSQGAPLSSSTTVVVISEMGRHPQLNTRGGREHWTFTPAMLIGGGIAGGQSVGGYNDKLQGQPVNLQTGEVDPSGSPLLPGHIGATLLKLAGLDPAPAGLPPIDALIQ